MADAIEVLSDFQKAIVVVVVFLADVLCALFTFFEGTGVDGSGYANLTVDALVLSLIRCVLFPLLLWFTVWIWNSKANTSPFKEVFTNNRITSNRNEVPMQSFPPSLQEPLRQNGHGQGLENQNGENDDETEPASPGSELDNMSAKRAFEMKRDHTIILKQADKRRALAMGVFFLISTAMSMYGGLKCVQFKYHPERETIQGMLLGSAIVWINLEYFLLCDFIKRQTEERGEITRMHLHPLYFSLGLKCHVCDICHERMKEPHYIAYRCRTCDFDMCPRCYRRKDSAQFKGFLLQIRGDDEQQITSWTYFVRIIKLSLPFWHLIALALGSLVVCQGLVVAAPHIQGNIFDSILAALRHQPGGKSMFTQTMWIYLAVNVFQGLFNGLKSLAMELTMRKLASAVRSQLFNGIMKMDIAFFDAMHSGQLTSRLSNDAGGMVQPLQTIVNDLVANLLLLVGGIVMSFSTSWKLSMLAITVVPPITYSYRLYAKWGRKLNRSIWQAFGDANAVATEAISNIRTVKAFSTEIFETGRYDDGVNTALKHGVKNAYVGASVSAFSSYLNLGTAVLILWYGGNVVVDSTETEMTIGELITFQLYWNMMNSAFISLGNVFNELIRASSAAERVLSLIDRITMINDDEGEALDKAQVRGTIELRDVEFVYPTRPEALVLNKVSMTMPSGTVTALVGKSGGGKSTLVHLLIRFYEPTGGSICLDGRDMKNLSRRSIRKACGFVAQDTQLWATSIEENVAYGLDGAYTKEELHEACKKANAHEFIMEMDEQYETRVGEKGVMLSGGQKQRIAVARCFLRKPKLLFLDEATSALDAENEGLVQKALDELIKIGNCTIVLIAHRLSTVIDANQIAVVSKGKIAERGTHDELMKKETGIYAQLVKRQMARDANTIIEERETADKKDKKGKKDQKKGSGTEIDDLFDELAEEGENGAGVALNEVN